MKKKVLIAVTSALVVSASVGIAVFALPKINKDNKLNEKKNEDSEYFSFVTKEESNKLLDEKSAEAKKLDKEIAEGKPDDSYYGDDNDSELEKEKAAALKELDEYMKNDVKAYPILVKYYGKDYSQEELITDRSLDIEYMKKMCKLYNSDKPTDEEKEILYNYVYHRIESIEDRDLRVFFYESIDAPY